MVGDEFNNALVVKEYPIYVLIADEVLPDFLAVLFRLFIIGGVVGV